jgi:hypothetical protein
MEIPASRANAHAYLLHLISSIGLWRETKANALHRDAIVKSMPGSIRSAEERIDVGSTSGEDR